MGKDKNDNYFKTCNICRDYSNQRKVNNKVQIQQYSKEHYQTNKEHKIELVKHWKEINHERLIDKVLCGCGGKFQYRSKAEHERSIKHIKYINNQNTTIL